MRLTSLFLFLVTAAIAITQGPSKLKGAGDAKQAMVFTSAPKYEVLAWMRGGERFPAGATLYLRDSKGLKKLFPQFAATADANISFEGDRVIFSGRKTQAEHWQIWEAALDDLQPRLVMATKTDAIRPFYLPDDKFVYSVKIDGRFVLETAVLDGRDQKRIFFAPANAIASGVLRDGRIVVNSTYPSAASGFAEIYTLYTDGSGYESVRCDHTGSRFGGTELNSGDLAFSHGSHIAKFSSPYAAEVAAEIPEGDYSGEMAESADGTWIVSTKTSKSGTYELRSWNSADKKLTQLVAIKGQDVVQPVLVAARRIPNRHPSGLHDWTFTNLMSLNVYASKHEIKEGSVSSVRVYSQDAGGAAVLLGSAPVEKDGSFFVRVPGDKALKFELTDASGKVVMREEGWYWSRAGEQRICVGCHAGPEHSPENAVPAVLKRSTEPTDLTGAGGRVDGGGH